MPEPDLKFALVESALRDLHPTWLPGLDADLLEQARSSTMARRWLATRLTTLALFTVPPAALDIADDTLSQSAWWQRSFRTADEPLLALGARGFQRLIKASIQRDKVLQWRRVLGRDLYEQILLLPAESMPNTAKRDAGNKNASIDLEDSQLAEATRRSACMALLQFAQQQHPLLQARVALAFPQAWSVADIEASWIPLPDGAAVEQQLREWSVA